MASFLVIPTLPLLPSGTLSLALFLLRHFPLCSACYFGQLCTLYVPPLPTCLEQWTHPWLGMKSPTSLPLMLGMLCVKSTQGLMRLAPAGMGRPISRMSTSSETHMPAPAESPINMMSVGEMGECVADVGGEMR